MGVHRADALRTDNFLPFLEGNGMAPFAARTVPEIAAAVTPVIVSVVAVGLPFGVTVGGLKPTCAPLDAGLYCSR